MTKMLEKIDNYLENTRFIKWMEGTKLYRNIEQTKLMKIIRKAENYTLIAKPRYAIPTLLILKGIIQWTGIIYFANEGIQTIKDKNQIKTESPLEKKVSTTDKKDTISFQKGIELYYQKETYNK